ncbi:pectate lyase [Saccharicrinis sp. FJH62]|uniref:pectate lyase n=1 Tax=Saccharicrinis sp. FJH62 TaxID=3344657 RepID=UPI0035D4C7F9
MNSHKSTHYILQVKRILTFSLLWILCWTVGNAQATKSINNDALKQKQEKLAEFKRTFYWWPEISQKSYTWYTSDEGKQITENILSWQDNGTGWPLMNTARRPFTGDSTLAGPWGMKAALVKATLNEIRFMARAYTATKDERCKTALEGGINYILDAQHKSGGWPHSYPYRMTDYSHYATYNDDVIPDIMTLLSEIMSMPDYRTIGEDKLKQVKEAYGKGLDFILKSQITDNGKLTAWAQQYDENTYEPKPARAFEPVAISGGEGASVLLFLMDIRKPSKEVKQAIEAGVKFYNDVQINGFKVVRENGDVVIAEDKNAGPLWARYYELKTHKPIFAGRDGIIKYNLSEIEKERRTGYAWYNQNGIKVLNRYAKWKNERKWDSQPATNTDESKVVEYSLPDPLLSNGKKVKTVKAWEKKRRPEIVKLFEEYQHGKTPDHPIRIKNEVLEKDVPGMNGLSKRTQVRITFPDYPEAHPIRVLLNVPANATGPVPTLLHISFTPNPVLFNEPGIDEDMAWNTRLKIPVPDKESWRLQDTDPKHFIDHGYGIATVFYGDIEPDFDSEGKYGVRSWYKRDSIQHPDDWGAIAAWSWGLSRIMDYLQTDPDVDGSKIALSGVSRLGKTVIWAGASDQRFAMVIPMVSGEGGAAISRRNFGETIADLTNPQRYYYWFAPRYSDYAFQPDQLPVDGHMLIALIAPRPVLLIVGQKDTWSDPKGEWVAAKAAEPVYELYGRKGLEQEEYPEPEKPILNDMGFYMHEEGHGVFPNDYQVMTDFMDLHFK